MAFACSSQAHSERAVAGQDISVHILMRSWLPSAMVRLAPQASEPGVGLSSFVHTRALVPTQTSKRVPTGTKVGKSQDTPRVSLANPDGPGQCHMCLPRETQINPSSLDTHTHTTVCERHTERPSDHPLLGPFLVQKHTLPFFHPI